MRIELESPESKGNTISEKEKEDRENYTGVKDEIRDQKAKFSELSTKGKLTYIWDYYKWFFIVGVIIVGALTVFVRDYMENLKPVYLNALMLNSNFGYDNTNTIEQDFINQYNIDTEKNHLYIDYSVTLSNDAFDTMMLASQQKIVSMYAAGELDVVIGPVDIMEGAANYDSYADLTKVLPQDLIEELQDRDYEFYYYDARKIAENSDEDESTKEEAEYREPYIAGIYLDNCSYLNNNGEYGAYDSTDVEGERPIFTIAVNAPHLDHAIEFLRFLIENR